MGRVDALTTRGSGIQNCIKTPAVVTNLQTRKESNTLAIWDTGATNSVITKAKAAELGLIPVSKTQVRGVGGTYLANIYQVIIKLNNQSIRISCLVTECEELSNVDDTGLLIGMDIIALGDFVITNHKRKTTMTFRVPSLQEIDYVNEIEEHKKIDKIHQFNVKKGLPDKCGCGSGKLYKNCHGQSVYAI